MMVVTNVAVLLLSTPAIPDPSGITAPIDETPTFADQTTLQNSSSVVVVRFRVHTLTAWITATVFFVPMKSSSATITGYKYDPTKPGGYDLVVVAQGNYTAGQRYSFKLDRNYVVSDTITVSWTPGLQFSAYGCYENVLKTDGGGYIWVSWLPLAAVGIIGIIAIALVGIAAWKLTRH